MKLTILFLLFFCVCGYCQEKSIDEIKKEIYYFEYKREGIEELQKLLSHNDPEIRILSVRALGRIQLPETITAIAKLLEDNIVVIREEAAFALGQMWNEQAESFLLNALKKENEISVQNKIIEALGKVGANNTCNAFCEYIEKESLCPAVTYASGLLAYRNVIENSLIKELIAHANDPSPLVRGNISYALMRAKNPRTIHHLIQLIYDTNAYARMNAARGLGLIKDAKGLPHLYLALHDKDKRVVINALNSLENFPQQINPTKMIPLLSSKNQHVKTTAIAVSGNLKLQEAEAHLCKILSEEEDLTKGMAIIALSKINPPLCFEWIKKINSSNYLLQAKIAEALGNIHTNEAINYLLDMSKTKDIRVMQIVISSLGKHDDERALKTIEKSLDTLDIAVVTYAAQALATKKHAKAMTSLIATYNKMKLPVDIEPMQAIIEAIGKLASTENTVAIDFLTKIAQGNNSQIAKIALQTLTDLGIQVDFKIVANTKVDEVLFSYEETHSLQPFHLEFVTNKGSFFVEPFLKDAPIAVTNWRNLIDKKLYNGITFHRVVPNFVVQGGDPRGDGWGGPGYTIPCEYNMQRYERGMVGMPLAGKDTGGCQLFITHSPQPHLNGKYTIFAHVIDGMDIVDLIQEGDVIQEVIIREVKLEEDNSK